MARPKLSESQVAHILKLWKDTEMNQTAIARLFKVSPTVIAKVLDGKYTPRPDDRAQLVYNVGLARQELLAAIAAGEPAMRLEKRIDHLIMAVTRECAG